MSIERFLEKQQKSVIHVRIDEKLHSDVVKAAKRLGVSITKLTEALFKEFLGKKK